MEWMGMDPWSGDAMTTWFQAWITGFLTFFGAVLVAVLSIALPVVVLIVAGATSTRRRFRCREAAREVEVEFARRPWLGGITAVNSCSAFECGAAISCHRRCLDGSYRRQWEPALPVIQRQLAE